MKKTLALIPTLIIALVYIFFFYKGDFVEFDVLAKEDYPAQLVEDIEKSKGTGSEKEVTVFQDEKYTYIYYSPDQSANEYITTTLDVKKSGEKYVVTAAVSYAVDDSHINQEVLIRLHKVPEETLIIKEIDNR
jgi:flagellar basal body-associated protein FliL